MIGAQNVDTAAAGYWREVGFFVSHPSSKQELI